MNIDDTILTIHYIQTVMAKGRGYDEFIEKANSCAMENYWREYRTIEFNLAKMRKDLSHDLTNKINSAIKSMLAEEIVQYIKKVVAAVANASMINNVNIKVKAVDAEEAKAA